MPMASVLARFPLFFNVDIHVLSVAQGIPNSFAVPEIDEHFNARLTASCLNSFVYFLTDFLIIKTPYLCDS